jgi:hypothetical protein
VLLLPTSTPSTGALLALVSTLAGNLLIVGSIANIIVVDAAGERGIVIDWRTHARARGRARHDRHARGGGLLSVVAGGQVSSHPAPNRGCQRTHAGSDIKGRPVTRRSSSGQARVVRDLERGVIK